MSDESAQSCPGSEDGLVIHSSGRSLALRGDTQSRSSPSQSVGIDIAVICQRGEGRSISASTLVEGIDHDLFSDRFIS